MLKTREQITEELVASGKEIAPDDPAQREANRRVASIDGVHVYFTTEEETARDAEEATVAAEQADYVANHKYKDDRKSAYGDVGDQLDMMFHDLANDSTTWKDHIANVKADHPKPAKES
jgi:hypothetical protein